MRFPFPSVSYSILFLALLSLLSLSIPLLVSSSSMRYVSPHVPSVAWLPIRPTVEGYFMDEDHPGPLPRCDHELIPIPASVALALRPDIDIGSGAGPRELDDMEPSFAFMFGGLGAGQEVLGDSWLLRVSSSRHGSFGDWYPITPQGTEPVLAPRHGYSLEWLPSAQRLVVFGGEDSSHYMGDAWEYVIPTNGQPRLGWQQISLNATGINSDPVARASNGGWIRIPSVSSSELERLVLFGGSTAASETTPSGREGLSDLWTLTIDSTQPSANKWTKPENANCTSYKTVCDDAQSFAHLFPNLEPTAARLQTEAHTSRRPEDVRVGLESIQQLNTNFSQLLNDPEYLNWADSHSTTDGACHEVCIKDDAASIPSRPSAREGHRASLWNWYNPHTGVTENKLIVFGGFSCPDGSSITPSCFDPNVYFLDLHTFTWSVLPRPPQPPQQPEQVWPQRRAFHSQHVYTTNTTAQLWVIGGTFTDMSYTLTFKNDVAVLNLVDMTWHIASSDLTNSRRIDEFGNRWYPHVATSRMASFLTPQSNQLWLHGGCHIGDDGHLTPNGYDDNLPGSLWVLKLGQYLKPDEIRIVNDSPDWLFGQGMTKVQPARRNYFFLEPAENIGFEYFWDKESPYYELNDVLLQWTLPHTNSSRVPYWGYNMPWATGLSSRFTVQMVSTKVQVGDTTTTTDSADQLLYVTSDVEETLTDGVYVNFFVLEAGSEYEVYVAYDGHDLPGSPYRVKLETGLVSPTLTRPADPSIPIPPIEYLPGTLTPKSQHYGAFDTIPEPLAGAGLGLVKGLRKGTASFLLQIVDIYENNWIDNTNAVYYLDETIFSAVPFDAINLTMSLWEPDLATGRMIKELTLNEFHYINNENGTYTVTYLVPDMAAYRLNISINGEMIHSGKTFLVEGVDPLELSDAQAAGMLSISVILTVAMIGMIAFFYTKRATPIMQSRSFLFDCIFLVGTIFGMFAILEHTEYSGGVEKWDDGTLHSATHNPCAMFNVLIGLAVLCSFGSLYAMVRRAHLIFKRVRHSAFVRDGPKKSIILNQDNPNCPSDAPIPTIPDVNPDWRILLPVIACIVIELVFQTIWYGAARMHPVLKVANDDFRTYMVCDGPNKDTWVFISIGLKCVMCLFFLYFIANGRRIGDPIGETRFLTWVGYNMSFASVVGILLVFFLDSQDSIKTAFIVEAFAIFWSGLMMAALVFAPRIWHIVRAKNMDQFWYDNWIVTVQEEELLARAREEKEAKDAKAGLSGIGNTSQLGNSIIGGSTAGPNPNVANSSVLPTSGSVQSNPSRGVARALSTAQR